MNTSNASSNPFRRSVHSSEYTNAGSRSDMVNTSGPAEAYIDNDPTLRPKASSSTTKKQVRISSPPRSPSPRRDNAQPSGNPLASHASEGAYYDGSARPGARLAPNPTGHDHTSSGGDDDSSSDDDRPGTMTSAAEESRGASNVPHNPFSRTLADMEGELGVSNAGKTPESAEPSGQPGGSTLSASRAAMDVNAFKNLLMTGKPPPNAAADPSSQPAHRAQPPLTLADSSSGTDTSSISRQSFVDPMAAETPRTSYERSISDEEEDIASALQRTASKRVKPPLPRRRHGKSVTATGPQIVSFDAFTTARTEQSVTSPTEDRSTRTSAEFRRPLPPIPQPATRPEPVLVITPERAEISPGLDPSEPTQTTQTKKTPPPPPPPLARRSSQRAPITPSTRPRSGTASSRPSLMDDNESIAESTTSSTRIAPPPPPARRSGHATSSTVDEGSPSSINRAPSFKSPPPPTRNRAASIQSNTSISSTLSTTPTAMGPAPSSTTRDPPPRPPPRRTSSRSSFEITSPRRTSGEVVRPSFGSERRPSMSSSVRRVPITEESAVEGEANDASPAVKGPSGQDILADMERFQREIDALVARDELGRRKGSAGSGSLPRPSR